MHDHLRDLGREMADELCHPRRVWRFQRFESPESFELSHPRRCLWSFQSLESLESKGFEKILTQPRVRCLLYFANGGVHIKCFLGESENTVETSTALLWQEVHSFHLLENTPSAIVPWIPLQNLLSLRITGGSLERFLQNCKQALFALKELHIYQSSELGLSLGSLRCLEKITIVHCRQLERVKGMAHLTKLVDLNISNCEELEELSVAPSSCLEKITIGHCRQLKRVKGMAHLMKLVDLNISNCEELEELSVAPRSCLEKVRIFNCKSLQCVAGISDLRKLVELQFEQCPELREEISLIQLTCLQKITILHCGKLKRFVGIFDMWNLVEVQIGNCSELELEEISFVQLNRLEKIRISYCPHLKSIEVKDCKKLRGLNVENLLYAVKLTICDCPELENLSEFVSLPRLKMVLLNKCPKLKKITIPTTLIKLTLQCCRELQAEGLYESTDVEELFISKCPELVELDELSFGRLSCLKTIAIDACGKIQQITGIEKLHSLERMQLFYSNSETVLNCILNMEKLPSDFIQVIGRADDGVESNLNASFFCDEHMSTKSVIQIGTDHDCPVDLVSAIILCAVVVVKTSTAADMINDFIKGCDLNPWLKFEVRQGEWLITSVINDPHEIHRYILNKGYCFPFDYVFTDQMVTEDVMVKKGYKVVLPQKKGEKHKALNLLRRIVHELL